MRVVWKVLFVLLVAVAVVLLWSTEWLVSFGGKVAGARLRRAELSSQWKEGRFVNSVPSTLTEGSTLEMFRRQFFGDEQRTPLKPIPVVRRTAADYASAPKSGLRATWMGWSTVLVEIDGRRVLTDPIWSERCSPSTLVGPKRFHAPPIALADLPKIDAVVVSHDHYDHLDMPAIRTLARRGTFFAVPLGMGAHLDRWGIPRAQYKELDWNESVVVNGLEITATPARHYSGRNPLRANRVLWASWVVAGPSHRFFYSGDSGYFPGFQGIGQLHGPFDLTIVKIGAYDRSWPDIHMTPEEAVRAHRDVGGKRMLAVHWATFNLGFHSWREPAERTAAAAREARAHLSIPRPGEFVEGPPSARPPEVWW
jgi:L-ascorbate metabolism protein UlaG (beta-lactamase superfamily)